MKVLVAYATAKGSTGEMAQFIGRIFEAYSIDTTVQNVEQVESVDEYDAVVMGSPAHAGMWLPQLSQFMQRFSKSLKTKQSFLWMACIRIVEDGGREHIINHYFYKPALEDLNINIDDIGIMAGKLKQEDVAPNERWMLSAYYDGDKLPGKFNQDFRDWQAIATWSGEIVRKLKASPSFETDPAHLMINDMDDSEKREAS